jgi:divalent metal cation (Fe/Co/Zn/Cd) transporter
LVASLIIFYNAFLIFRPALGEIMDEHRYDDFITIIREKAKNVSGIHATEKCWVRKSGMRYWVDLHIHVDGNLSVHEGHTIAHDLKKYLMDELPEIEDILVHVEPV